MKHHTKLTFSYLKVDTPIRTDESNSPIDLGERREIRQQCKFINESKDKTLEHPLIELQQVQHDCVEV